jgi:hypothetical protein
MGRTARLLYIAMLCCFGAIAAIGALAGVWIWAIAALVLGLAAAVSGVFVFGQKWRPEAPRAHTRAVTRRRR